MKMPKIVRGCPDVLIVEPHDDTATAMRTALEERVGSLTIVCTLGEARKALEGRTFDIWIVELDLGAERGCDLLGPPPTPPEVLTIATSIRSIHARGSPRKPAGFDRYLAKPFDLDALLRVMGLERD